PIGASKEEAIVTSRYRLCLGAVMLSIAASSLGCVTGRAPAAEGPPAFESVLGRNYSQEDGVSLFKGDSAVLTDSDIARILSFNFTLRADNRLAVLALGHTSLWSEESAKVQADNTRAFVDRLKVAHRIREVAELPLLLVPEKQTVP